MLSQLVYVSNRQVTCPEAEIEKILASCRKKNASLDITGVLLYSPTRFIQYLEGDAKEILRLYDRIKTDPRHRQVRLVSYGSIQNRAFPSWQMATKEISQIELTFRTNVSSPDRQTFKRLLSGQEQSGSQVQLLLKKFFTS
ncbi:MAG: BLUF domain-containing protein [Ferruginibacter sp.]|nr:BLUF domain-containing protein [Cytophagales bacterium]